MNRTNLPLLRGSLILLLAFGLTAIRVTAQQFQQTFSRLPTSFSAEDDKFPNAVPLPGCVRHLLASDERVVNVLKYEHLSPAQLPADWFTASERDLEQGNEKYLVVMGSSMMRGANVNPFWIFRRSENSCDLLLTVAAHHLEVLKAKTNGLPDIKLAALTAIRYFENEYRFDGNNYRAAKRTSQPIGEEIPQNLSDFETREPLVQRLAQNPEPIICEARAWLWQQWWLEKPSYLKVTLYSIEGDETTTTYFIRKSGGALEVLIQKHQVIVDRTTHAGARQATVEDEIIIAADVERRLALKNNPDRKTNVPES
jgi:hypothetical protein